MCSKEVDLWLIARDFHCGSIISSITNQVGYPLVPKYGLLENPPIWFHAFAIQTFM
jgi:hypothetical protein